MQRPLILLNLEMSRCRIVFMAITIVICTVGNSSRSTAQAQIRAVKILRATPRSDIVASYVFNGVDEETFKKQLNAQATLVVDGIVKIAAIDESQRQKLMLAATGDLRRFYRDLEIVREKTKDLDMQNQVQMQKAWPIVMPVRERVSEGIHNESSLFKKVLGTVLTAEQQSTYDEYLQKRDRFLYAGILRATIADLEKSLPLTALQRTKLLELGEASPFPKKVDKHALQSVGWTLLARIDETELAKVLDANQHKTFKQLTGQFANQARGLAW